jgi:hypothetical protein
VQHKYQYTTDMLASYCVENLQADVRHKSLKDRGNATFVKDSLDSFPVVLGVAFQPTSPAPRCSR